MKRYNHTAVSKFGWHDCPEMGAVDFLEKPVDDQDLLTAIDRALDTDRHRQDAQDDV
jgi:FixJ family two-component response regulator